MILRIALVIIAIFFLLSFLERKFSPRAAERAAMRKRAWKIAVRKTAFSLGALALVAVTAFAGWHSLRFEDSAVGLVAVISGVLALVLGYFSYRTGRR